MNDFPFAKPLLGQNNSINNKRNGNMVDPLSNIGLNYLGPLIRGIFFNEYIGNFLGDLWQFEKKNHRWTA